LPGETDKRDENLEEAGQYPNERRAFLLQFWLYKVKVKVSLCLPTHHAMKAYWGSGGIAPLILRPWH
jgi:hypothetical protein